MGAIAVQASLFRALPNLAADFGIDQAGFCGLMAMPPPGQKNFRLVLRAARVHNHTGYFIQFNTPSILDGIGFYQQNGNWLAYFQALDGAAFFRPITTADTVALGQYVEIAFERTGNTFTARQNGQVQWQETRDVFTLDTQTVVNIAYRGGGGGGGEANAVIDYLYWEVQEPSGWVRHLDFQFNTPDWQNPNRAMNSGALGGFLSCRGPLRYFTL